MKQFLIIRHAKSSWSDMGLKDIDRPLNKRGLHDAPKMADILSKIDTFKLEYIYSSPANRALTTAKQFHKTLDVKKEIDIRLDIYHADVSDLLHVLENTDDEINCFAIFGHNPGFTYLVNHFYQEGIENLPTCGIAHFQTEASSWLDLNTENTKLVSLMFPKKLIY